jgi:hypothetical protein
MRFRTSKSYVIGYISARRGATDGFYNFPTLLRLLINVNINAALKEKGMKNATFLPIANGKCS